MIEKVLAKVSGNKIEELNKLLLFVRKNEGSVIKEAEDLKEIEELVPFFAEEEYFVKAINANIKNLKVFSESDFQRARNYLRAKKVRNYLIQRIEEAIGLREIADNKFDNYKIVANRIKVDVKMSEGIGANLIEKVDYKDIIFTLTSKNGIKKANHQAFQGMIDVLNNILADIKTKGYYDTSIAEAEYRADDYILPFKITCDKIHKR